MDMTDLKTRRGRVYPGGNPTRFVELTGGEDIEYSFYEPDPVTCRSPYWYDTRNNILYKRMTTKNVSNLKTDYYWVSVSQL